MLGCSADSPGYVVEPRSPALGNDGRLAQDVGIETQGGVFTPLLASGCAAPCSTSQVFSTAEDNQTRIQVLLYRGNAKLVSQAHFLGRFEITGFAEAPRGVPRVEVTFLASGTEISLQAIDASSAKRLAIRRVEH
jgi:molecular chaperone DnaK